MPADPEMHLVRDVLDNRVLDRAKRPIGQVDGLSLELRDGRPPRVAEIEIGGTSAARRLVWPLRAVVEWATCRWGAQRGAPFRIPWSAVRDVGVDIEVDLDARDSPALHWARAVARIISRIPGG